MEFIAQFDKLRMAHLTREKELIRKKERSLLHVLEFERKLEKKERNMKTDVIYEWGNAKTSEMNKLKTTHVLLETMSRR